MPLPAAAQAQREAFKAGESAPSADAPAAPAPADAPAADAPAPSAPTGEAPAGNRVTLSREEFNELQAAKDKVNAAERRSDALRADLDVTQSRLTELETAAKGSGNGVAAPAPASAPSLVVDATPIPLTEKETTDFEPDTIAMMEKIATNIARREIAKFAGSVESKLGEVETTAKNAVTSVGRVASNSFTDNVRKQVAEFSDFDTIVKHTHWQDFLQSEDDLSDATIGQILQRHITSPTNTSLAKVVKIFRTFFDKYIKDATNSDGYAGAVPSGATVVDIQAGSGTGPKMLKYSDRKKLHDDYLAKSIKYEDYMTKKAEFDLADREGRIDYNN